MTNQEAIRVLKNVAFMLKDGTQYMTPNCEIEFHQAYEMAIKALEREPSKGEWIDDDIAWENGDLNAGVCCSICGGYAPTGYYYFCPNCGADMRGEPQNIKSIDKNFEF